MIEAMGLQRSDTRLCRDPAELKKIDASVVVALGAASTQALLGSEVAVAPLRGKFQSAIGDGRKMKIMPTFHPSELLNDPALKRDAWNDLLAVAAELGIQIPKKGT
jgi:DNA polymerase